MPRTSNLRLNEKQEQALVDYVIQRKGTLWDDNFDKRIKIDREAWDRYNLDVGSRKSGQGTIFPLSNLPIPVFAMVMEHFVSRCEDTTTGDEPYFHFEAVGAADEGKALAYDRYFNWKFKQGRVHADMLESHLPTFVQKAHILKATFVKQVANWMDFDKNILFYRGPNGEAAQQVEVPNHGPIIQGEDQFVAMPDPIASAHADPESVAMGQQELPTRQHLQADPSFVYDEGKHVWAKPPAGLKRSEVIYSGPKSENVPFDRFLCAMDAPSVHETDVMELEDKPYSWIRDNWLERPWALWAQYQSSLKHGDASSDTAREIQDKATTQTTPPENRRFDTINPRRKVIEAWVTRDVLGDGTETPQEFVIWIDVDSKMAIYYEWVAKVCPDMKKPYTVLAISKDPNRWCGKSIWEKGKEIFDAIDRMWNGEFYRALMQANPPKGGDLTALKDQPDKIEFGPDVFYETRPGKTMDDALQFAQVPDTNARSQMILEYLVFWIQLWLGISNLAQGDYQAVNTNTTKYGIAKTLEQASMLGRRWIRRVIEADEEHLQKLVLIAIATMPDNQKELYEYTDGDQRKIAELSGSDIRNLRMHARVVIGQNAESQDIERAKTAIDVQEKYFQQLNPEVRKALRPLLVEILEDLGYKNVDDLLPEFEGVPLDKSAMGGEGMKVVAAATGDPNVAAAAGQPEAPEGGDQSQPPEQPPPPTK